MILVVRWLHASTSFISHFNLNCLLSTTLSHRCDLGLDISVVRRNVSSQHKMTMSWSHLSLGCLHLVPDTLFSTKLCILESVIFNLFLLAVTLALWHNSSKDHRVGINFHLDWNMFNVWRLQAKSKTQCIFDDIHGSATWTKVYIRANRVFLDSQHSIIIVVIIIITKCRQSLWPSRTELLSLSWGWYSTRIKLSSSRRSQILPATYGRSPRPHQLYGAWTDG